MDNGVRGTRAREFNRFAAGSARLVLGGGRIYWAWMIFLAVLIAVGAFAYWRQLTIGLELTAMRDPVSWGFYIGNFTFMVGVAAAAVILVIPAYVYDWKPIREIVIFGELLAISAIVICLLLVMVDIGRPERFWHMMPIVGYLNFPNSLLAWDMLVLNLYLAVNVTVVAHILYRAYAGRPYDKRLVVPLVLFSIPMAIGIHTVTAFLYNGLAARPYWNASILAPQFLASAFSAGPAILLVMLQILRRATRFEIRDEAIWKIAELMAYAIFLNLFLHGAEVFKEYYSNTEHALHTRYWFQGLGEHRTLVPYAWTAVSLNLLALVLFLVPATRRNVITLNIGCAATYAGCYIEKGMGLIIPGFTPSTLGEIYVYVPTLTEVSVAAGIFAFGFLLFTVLLRIAVPILLGEFRMGTSHTEETTMKRSLTIAGAAGAILLAATVASAQDAKAEKGMKIFAEQKCTTCHSIAGKGNKKGALDTVGSKLTPAEIREWIVDPVGMAAKTKPAPTRKPVMKKKPLAAGDVDALVALLSGLKKS
jgi:molybdopterin-containing oxidoreductase family membrane subunit